MRRFKQLFVNTYTKKRTIGQWQLELSSCKQDYNENVLTYASKVENCYVQLINSY